MPVTPNLLLQAATKAKSQAAAANNPVAAAEPGDKAASFANVFAKQAQKKPAMLAEAPVKPARDKVADAPAKKDVSNDKSAAADQKVADSGKSLPADKPAAPDDKAASEQDADAETPVAVDASPVDASPVDPTLDPALAQATQAVTPAPAPETPPTVATEQPQAAAVAAAAAAALPVAAAATADTDFDPEADPLDALPALRMAMEQSGHVSASSQNQSKATAAQLSADGEPTAAQNFTAGMANMLNVQSDKDSTGQGGDKAFSGLLNEGLKDLSSSSSDTRVDDFASRLAALTQAATPKTANVAVPVNQPIAMHQSGWTEEVVNRVMYLSSVNLKAADIQLQPAELGRLDIRVNMVPDQQTQITFMSAHPSVREALDGQMHRLRDMFAQQGMGQVDVNVSDQSRGWQGQGQEQQAQQGQGGRTSASGGRVDSMDDEIAPTVAEVAASSTSVIGSSAVDYYA
ncbi:flagellar hook-length control protein FliK [Pseudomonas prosekii]|uniref:Flagellar hook-length control protein FliK n=1 Tax=Pseudomonas prosekii TaxID=1148509 RepID=A0A3L8CEV9_9PSED|nr:flagellar hook-length control protein FliK [Pseudomonas prosekii]RLU06680.1 flagellar hook-length control protein FliK [Pseudomonas prosekii]RLU07012.1 flagellar hook-length control protein FliK [Pseudomonas prosekii]